MEQVSVYFSRKIRYNDKKREGMNMQAAVKANEDMSEKTAIEAIEDIFGLVKYVH